MLGTWQTSWCLFFARLEAPNLAYARTSDLPLPSRTFRPEKSLGKRNVGMLGPRRVSRCMSMLGCLDERVVKLEEEVGSVLSNSP